MNTYGHTFCPKCKCANNMYRPIEEIRKLPAWDLVQCWFCLHQYKHTEVLNEQKPLFMLGL